MPTAGLVVLSESHLEAGVVCVRGRGVPQLSLLHSLPRLQAEQPGQMTADRAGTTGTEQERRQLLISVSRCIPPVSLCLPPSACAYPCQPVPTPPRQPVPTPVSLCLPLSACAYPRQPVLTSVSRCRARKQAARLRCSLARFSAHGCCSLAGKSRSE